MKIKDLFKELLAICVLVPLLHNFCNAGYDLQLINSGTISVTDYASYTPIYKYDVGNSNLIHKTFCLSGLVLSGPTSSDYYKSEFRFGGNDSESYSIGGNFFQFYTINGFHIFGCVYIDNYTYNPKFLTIQKTYNSSSYRVSFDMDYEVYELVNSLNDSCQSDLSSCEFNLATATGNLATCISNLATATGNLATCNSNLSSCQADLSECENSNSGTGNCTINDKIEKNIIFSGSKNFSNAGYSNMFNYGDYGAGTYCLKFTSDNAQTLSMGFANGGTTAPTNLYSLYNDQYGNWICLYGNKPYLNVKLNSSSNTISYEVYKLTDLLSSSIPCSDSSSVNTGSSSCDTGSILSGYILESSVDSEYCEYNFNLISPSNCPVCSGGVSNWSSLWINNIQHLGASNIYMSIPEEISRDYSYSNSGEIMEIDVEGYNVDYDYINNVVEIQKYKPSDEDFNNIIGILAQYMPIIVIFIGLLFLYKLLKKPFSSKKL